MLGNLWNGCLQNYSMEHDFTSDIVKGFLGTIRLNAILVYIGKLFFFSISANGVNKIFCPVLKGINSVGTMWASSF